jgi:hypothetical protein
MTKLTAMTATSIRFIGSRSWASAIADTDGGFSPLIWLGPYCASRDVASAWVRPFSASLPKAERTADSSCANQLAACGSGAVVATSTILGPARGGPHHPAGVIPPDGGSDRVMAWACAGSGGRSATRSARPANASAR